MLQFEMISKRVQIDFVEAPGDDPLQPGRTADRPTKDLPFPCDSPELFENIEIQLSGRRCLNRQLLQRSSETTDRLQIID